MSTSPIITWFSNAGNMIVYAAKSFSSWIKKLFTRKTNVTDPGNSQPGKVTTEEDNGYEEYSDKIFGQDNVIINLGVHKRVSATHRYMYEIGRKDGAHGVQLVSLVDLAQAKAQEMFRHIYVTLKGSLASALAQQKTQAAIMDSDKKCYEREEAYYDYVKYQYRYFPRAHSWKLGLFYLVIALALVLADIPLALTLIRLGFNLPGSDLADLFLGNFWQKIAENWETVTTAMGIALCTVYIKIFYDDFIGTPYGSKVMTYRKFIGENNLSGDSEEQLPEKINKEYQVKQWWKIGLALFTLAVIVILGLFRLEATQKAEEAFQLTRYGSLAFIGITILFPTIGGICLSHAFANFQNIRRLGKAKTSYDYSRNKYLRSVEQFSIIEKKFEDLDAADKRLNEEGKIIDEYRAFLMAFYKRGYAIGAMQPENKEEDFYSKVMQWRNIAMGRKINTHINKLNQS